MAVAGSSRGRFGALTTRRRCGTIRCRTQRREGGPISEERRPPTPAGGWWQDERGRWRQGPREEPTPSSDATAGAATAQPEPQPEPEPDPDPAQAPTPAPTPRNGPSDPAGEWWQDESGKWQQRPRSTVPTRLDEIREQIGNLDNASKFFGRKEIKELPSILWEDERVERLIQGTYSSRMGVLVATNKRLIFVDKGIARLRVEDFPYDKLTSIQYQTGLMMGTVTIFASGNRADIQNVAKDQCRAFADYVRARISAPAVHASAPAAPPAAPSQAGDMLEQLERLGRLRDSGVLSPEEFEQQKQRILGVP